jgi:hypothetical protein
MRRCGMRGGRRGHGGRRRFAGLGVVGAGVLVWAAGTGGATAGVQLVDEGSSDYTIVLDPAASPSEAHAAEDLQSHLQACTGAVLPIAKSGSALSGPMVVLGCGGVARGLGVNPSAAALGEQSYLLRTVGEHLVIAGSRQAGTLYGVHRFLEEFLGVRWYAPGVTKYPFSCNVEIPAVDRLVRPAFAFRNTSYAWPGADADFRCRMGDNSGGGGADNPTGVQYSFDGRCHSYFQYISPSEFWDSHPEYFSEKGGVRISENTQLCLTNPDVLDIVTERMLERMRTSPGVRQHNFSQMDWYNYCECANCRAMNEQLGTTGGTQYWFVNQLAARTATEFPDKIVSTLAYMYTEEPPTGTTMHPNVAVWLCHMYPCCDSHPIATCPLNAEYKRRAETWSRICSHLYIWHYIVDFAHYYNPFPNFRSMAADMRFYRDIRAEGIYLQGAGDSGGEFSLLRPYYGMKLVWDPDQDADAIRDDFLQGYYGDAWEPIRDYIELLGNKVEQEDIHMHLYTNPAQGHLPDEVVAQATALFDKAEELAGSNDELLDRVQVARMPVQYARLFPRNGYRIADGRWMMAGPVGTFVDVQQFVRRMHEHGFTEVRELDGDADLFLNLFETLTSRPPVYTIGNQEISADIVPALGGRILRIVHLASGKCATAENVPQMLYFPFSGGMEHRVGGIFWWYGVMEPSTVADVTQRSITLQSYTMDGLLLSRRVEADASRPAIRVEATLGNPGSQTRDLRLRSHLELSLGNLREASVGFRNLAGREVQVGISDVIPRMREGQYFEAEQRPAGEWAFKGSNGLTVTHRFGAQEIDFARIYAFPEDLGELEVEIWAKRQTGGTGQEVRLAEEIELAAVPQYELTARAEGGHGTVLPEQGTFDEGTVVRLTALPDPGYLVWAWHGMDDDSSTSNTNSVTMDGDKEVTVEFRGDCNGNGTHDGRDVAEGRSKDCNGNGMPDECDVAERASEDCNGNGVPDECDLSAGQAADRDGNGVPDECEPDCNENDIPDAFEIANGTASDCNENGLPDDCDIAAGTLEDENGDGAADRCQVRLTVEIVGEGRIEQEPDKALYVPGEEVALRAVPAAGWRFAEWSGDATSLAHVISVSVRPAMNLTARFENPAPAAMTGRSFRGVVGEAVQFDGSGFLDPLGEELTLTWDFGDGTSGEGFSPEHSYAAAGYYVVLAAATDPAGNRVEARMSAIVTEPIPEGPGDGDGGGDVDDGNGQGYAAPAGCLAVDAFSMILLVGGLVMMRFR